MKTYDQVAEMFASIANKGKNQHHGALSTRRNDTATRLLYAPKLDNTSESMSTRVGWDVVGTFADVADHVVLAHESGESRCYKLAPAPAPEPETEFQN